MRNPMVWMAVVVLLPAAVSAGPRLGRYSFSCSGSYSGGIDAEVGVIEFTSATAAVGSAHLDLGSGSVFTRFTATLVNGTADSQGSGGNGTPRGCFTGRAFFSGDTFGVNEEFFGCFNRRSRGFDWIQTTHLSPAGPLTCRGALM